MSKVLDAIKTTTAVFITVLVLSFLSYNIYNVLPEYEYDNPYRIAQPIAQMSAEQKASHMITYLNDDGKQLGLCTGTAIGPHALLTAAHCNDSARPFSSSSTDITIDYSTHKYHIVGSCKDDRDHEVYLIDGPALTNVVNYVPNTQPKAGQHVYYYGFGEGIYPSTKRQGIILTNDDPSDVDARAQFYMFSFDALHGDSGAAIFSDDGLLVGLVTYTLPWNGQHRMGAFGLNFSPQNILIAQHFDPEDKSTYPSQE